MAHKVSHFCFMAVLCTALFLSHFLRPFLHSFAVAVVFDFKALKTPLNSLLLEAVFMFTICSKNFTFNHTQVKNGLLCIHMLSRI
jgi:hypothetical protein